MGEDNNNGTVLGIPWTLFAFLSLLAVAFIIYPLIEIVRDYRAHHAYQERLARAQQTVNNKTTSSKEASAQGGHVPWVV